MLINQSHFLTPNNVHNKISKWRACEFYEPNVWNSPEFEAFGESSLKFSSNWIVQQTFFGMPMRIRAEGEIDFLPLRYSDSV